MEEEWRSVPGYENLYQVSNLGRIKALAKKVNTWNGGRYIPETIIKPIVQHSGYAHVGLWRNQKCKQVRLHRLVAEVFIPNDDVKHKTQVNHKNENKLDNRVSNLEWCTPKYNTNYGKCISKRAKGKSLAVECLDTTGRVVARFEKIIDALIFVGKSPRDGHISACCRGFQKTAYGYRWQYAKGGMPNDE